MYNSDLAEFIMVLLIVYRVTRFIVVDNGPFDVFLHIRLFMGVYDHDENGKRPMLGILFGCGYCMSTWISAFMAVLLVLLHNESLLMMIPVWLTLSGAVTLLWSDD